MKEKKQKKKNRRRGGRPIGSSLLTGERPSWPTHRLPELLLLLPGEDILIWEKNTELVNSVKKEIKEVFDVVLEVEPAASLAPPPLLSDLQVLELLQQLLLLLHLLQLARQTHSESADHHHHHHLTSESSDGPASAVIRPVSGLTWFFCRTFPDDCCSFSSSMAFSFWRTGANQS